MADQDRMGGLLKHAFERRRASNPTHSLRAFARDLGITASAVSEILRGKRTLSLKMATRLVDRLGDEIPNRDEVLTLLAHKSEQKRPRRQTLSSESFKLVANWHHMAILSLLEVKDFNPDPRWIAGRLGISLRKARESLDLLEKSGRISRTRSGRLVAQKAFTSPDGVPSVAVRRAHHETLSLARRSLEQDALNARDFTFMTMAADPRRLPKAREKIRKFHDQLCRYLEGGEKQEVYRMAVCLFPISKAQETDSIVDQA